jgi:hypothetical protein
LNLPSTEMLRKARDHLQETIEKSKVADRIGEDRWREGFIEELRTLTRNQAIELAQGVPEVDKVSYKINLEEWVHARVLLMILDLTAWIGPEWSSHFRNMTEEQFLDVVRKAFESNLPSTAIQPKSY